MSKIKTVLIEPSYIIRKGMLTLLNEFKEIRIIQKSNSLQETRTDFSDSSFDLLIVNENVSGKFTRKQIKQLFPLLNDKNILWINANDAINTSEENKINIHHQDKKEIIEIIQGKIKQLIRTPQDQDNSQLSKREIMVLREIALGLTNKEVAVKLFISTHTVVTHRKNITRKLGIKTVSGLTVYALINNIISTDDVD